MIINNGDWGLGIGDWGLEMGIGPNPQTPKPKTPKPKPQELKIK